MSILTPEYTDFAIKRQDELANKPKAEYIKVPYIGSFREDDEPYDITDFNEVRNRINTNVKTAIEKRFPLQSDKYILSLENVDYQKKQDRSLDEQKDALLNRGTVSTRLKADWVLYDKATGKELERKNTTLLNVPYLTERGTFVNKGSEYAVKHMFRLRSGAYTRIKGDGNISTHINPEQGTGQQGHIDINPETGVFTYGIGTRNYGLLPLLKTMGADMEAVEKSWGSELFKANAEKYKGILNGTDKAGDAEYATLWNDKISKTIIDSDTTINTLGVPYKNINPDMLMNITNKMLKLAQTGDTSLTDDRDALQFQKVLGPADYISEHIVRDGGGVFRNILNSIDKVGDLSVVPTGAFQPHADAAILKDKHSGYIDGSSPFEALDFATGISRLGEGGIGSTRAAPNESRAVQNSYLGFVDPIRSPECYSEDTEIYTDKGWISVRHMNEDTMFACLIDGKTTEFHKASKISSYDYDGIMYGATTAYFDFKVTPNHRMYVTTKIGGEFEIIEMAELFERKASFMLLHGLGVSEIDCIESRQPNSLFLQMGVLAKEIYAEEYKGKVYCPTVPGGLVYVRRVGGHGLWCGNSMNVGLDNYLALGVRKDSRGNLYNRFIPKGQTKPVYVDMTTVANSITATPEYFDPSASPEEYIPAFVRGKELEYVQRKDVDFFLASPSNMMSLGGNTIPGVNGIRSNRTLMGCLHPETDVIIKDGNSIKNIKAYDLVTLDNPLVITDIVDGEYIFKRADSIDLVVSFDNVYTVTTESGKTAIVSESHRWLTFCKKDGLSLVRTDSVKLKGRCIPIIDMTTKTKTYEKVVSVEQEMERPRYVINVDVNDNTYLLGNGMLTHNSKYGNQALSLVNREQPLVRSAVRDGGDDVQAIESMIGKHLGARFSPIDGTVVRVDDDAIIIKDASGNRQEIELYNNFPANQQGYLSNTAKVKAGDKINKGSLLATSNYTDDQGNAALGTNVKVAYMTGLNAGTFEDAATISESAAKTKFASEQLYKTKTHVGDSMEYDKAKFLRLFDTKEFTPAMLDNLGDDGVVKEGTVLNYGDPMVIAVQKKDPSIRGIARNANTPFIQTWEHHYPGTVTQIARHSDANVVYTKAVTPMQVGDKGCYDDKTEVLTSRGWQLFKNVRDTDKIWTMDTANGDCYFSDYTEAMSYDHHGVLYAYESDRVSLRVTTNHRCIVSSNPSPNIMNETAKRIKDKPYYWIVGMDIGSIYDYTPMDTPEAKQAYIRYSGRVYCLTIPLTHTMYVRRRGKKCWSGNSNRYGAKFTVAQVLPEDQMPRFKDGTAVDLLQAPLGLPSRINPVQLAEPHLSKIARKTGKPFDLESFAGKDIAEETLKLLKDNGLEETTDLYDPHTGKTIPDVTYGEIFVYKLKHMADKKQGARGTGDYTSEDIPSKGGHSSSRRLGSLETSAVIGHDGIDSELMRDAKLIRGQRNDEFWRDLRDGRMPSAPGNPLVHKKFFAHLQAAGISLDDRGQKIHMFGATDSDLEKLTQNRQVTKAASYSSKTLEPIEGGLFDPKVFGAEGDQFGYIDLPEPLLNPLMFKPTAAILGWKERDLRGVLEGEKEVEGLIGTQAVLKQLEKLDLDKEFEKAKTKLKDQSISVLDKDKALKKYRALYPLIENKKQPNEFFISRVPVLPPKFRPVSAINEDSVNIVADANFLYKRLMDNLEDFKEAKTVLPEDELLESRKAVYNSLEATIGLKDPTDRKLVEKDVKGLLRWAFGKNSPKLSSLHRKVLAATVDVGARGVIIPDNSLNMNQAGIPENSAWDLYEPFIVRGLRQKGMSLMAAIDLVKDRKPEARTMLLDVMDERPIMLNRAPTLHKFGIMGFNPKLVKGDTIHISPSVVKPFNADFDGDTILNLVKVEVNLDKLKENAENINDYRLNFNLFDVYYTLDNQNSGKDANMISSNNKVNVGIICGLDEIPVIAGSEVKKSDTVTEWQVPEGIYVNTLDPNTGEGVRAPMTHVSKHTDLKMYNVTMSVSGNWSHVVTASEDHSLIAYTYDDETKSSSLTKIRPCDAVGAIVPKLLSDSVNDSTNCTKYIKIGNMISMSHDLGVFIGAMIGDGWVDANNTIRIACDKECVRTYLMTLLKDNVGLPKFDDKEVSSFTYPSKERYTAKDTAHRLTVYSTLEARKDLKQLIGTGAENKRIPAICMTGSRTHMIGILKGLLITDGTITYNEKPAKGKKTAVKCVAYTTCSPLLRDGIQAMMAKLGVRVSATVSRGANSTMDSYCLTFSLTDLARLYKERDDFRLPVNVMQDKLARIVADITGDDARMDYFDIVPFPKHLDGEFILTGLNKKYFGTQYAEVIKRGYMPREKALGICSDLDDVIFSECKVANKTLAARVIVRTEDERRALVDEWSALVRDTSISWEIVDSVDESAITEGWDCTVPGPWTFALATGTIVQDTMNAHVPVSKQAVKRVRDRLMPSSNLLNPADMKAHIGPSAEFIRGLAIATRDTKAPPKVFKTRADANKALERGEIAYDTPITLLDQD